MDLAEPPYPFELIVARPHPGSHREPYNLRYLLTLTPTALSQTLQQYNHWVEDAIPNRLIGADTLFEIAMQAFLIARIYTYKLSGRQGHPDVTLTWGTL